MCLSRTSVHTLCDWFGMFLRKGSSVMRIPLGSVPRRATRPAAREPHVLHVTQPVEGGVARFVTDLAAAQLAAGLRVTVACPRGGTLTDALRAAGCRVLP